MSLEVVLRLLVLKHIRNWILKREVRANLVYRDFTRVGAAKMPDAKTIGRWGVAMGPAVIHQIHDRIVQITRANDVVPAECAATPPRWRLPAARGEAPNSMLGWPRVARTISTT